MIDNDGKNKEQEDNNDIDEDRYDDSQVVNQKTLKEDIHMMTANRIQK